ncbi:FCS-Like Zinc finger 10-like [Andrographis paniculata]|uniref:FCS-Like Zinc finger 10-like n=1 Tax=Andrographis paniculata TaxID=175694 RepID=UPI0021E736FD|nr:FCS-Like Zinc finger 10-like [Andrographis paniculata]
MPFKRSRIGSSSTHQEMPPATVMKAGEPSKILDIESPLRVGQPDQVKIGGFLERCHFCKKRIAQNSEVFMYSNLCAFCSAECRDRQIALDRSCAKKQPGNSKEKVPGG